MTENRLISNYPAKKFAYAIPFTDEIAERVGVPVRLQLSTVTNFLSFKIWKSEEAFVIYSEPLPKAYEFPFGAVENPFLDAIKESALGWLGVDDDWQIEQIDINLTTLKISASARHKTRANKRISDETANADEFEQIKTDFAELVGAFAMFAWQYAKENNSELAKFN